jgi:predicted aspartyl protease
MNRLLYAALLLSAEPSLALPPSAPDAVLPLRDVSGAGKVIEATVSGKPALFLFDTGEGVTTVTPAFAQHMGCRPWGQITGFRMSGERLDLPRCDGVRLGIGKRNFAVPIAGVFDLMKLLPGATVELAGSVGLDVFADRHITIEPKASRIVIESRRSFARRIRGAIAVPARLVRDAEGVALAIDVAVPTASGVAWMELDTGNGGTLVIGKHVAGLLGLDPSRTTPQPASFRLANGVLIAGEARVRDLIMDGNIGQRVWQNWNVTMDLGRGRVWLSPA